MPASASEGNGRLYEGSGTSQSSSLEQQATTYLRRSAILWDDGRVRHEGTDREIPGNVVEALRTIAITAPMRHRVKDSQVRAEIDAHNHRACGSDCPLPPVEVEQAGDSCWVPWSNLELAGVAYSAEELALLASKPDPGANWLGLADLRIDHVHPLTHLLKAAPPVAHITTAAYLQYTRDPVYALETITAIGGVELRWVIAQLVQRHVRSGRDDSPFTERLWWAMLPQLPKYHQFEEIVAGLRDGLRELDIREPNAIVPSLLVEITTPMVRHVILEHAMASTPSKDTAQLYTVRKLLEEANPSQMFSFQGNGWFRLLNEEQSLRTK